MPHIERLNTVHIRERDRRLRIGKPIQQIALRVGQTIAARMQPFEHSVWRHRQIITLPKVVGCRMFIGSPPPADRVD